MHDDDIIIINGLVSELQAAENRRRNEGGSQDDVDELRDYLGNYLGKRVFLAEGPNEYVLDRDALQSIESAGIGDLRGSGRNQTLVIEDPNDPDEPIEVPIIDPTSQYDE